MAIELHDWVIPVGQMVITRSGKTCGVPENPDKMGSPRHGQEEKVVVLDAEKDATKDADGNPYAYEVIAFHGRFASLQRGSFHLAWDKNKLQRVEKPQLEVVGSEQEESDAPADIQESAGK